MTGYWCERALVADRVLDGVVITTDGGVIASVESDVAAAPPGTTRLEGVTLPGFANAHSHAFHRALRGRTQGGGGTFWTWRDQMYRLAASLDPDTYEELATATFAEMALAGYTVVGEFHYLHHGAAGVPYADPNEMGRRLLRAAERAGIRITLLDTCYLHGGIGQPLNDVQLRFSDGSAGAWADRASAMTDSASAQNGAAIHSVRAVDPDAIARVARWADENATRLHAHVSEQPKENEDCIAAYGTTPIGLLGRAGVLGGRFTAIHATHVTSGDIAALRGCSVCICATTERELADGIGPTGALSETGVSLCVGSDSHAVIDPFEEVRAIELNERLASRRRGTHQPHDLLTAGTRSGYASLGWDGGVIAPGHLADFVTVGFGSPRLAGSDRDEAPAAIVFGAAPADVRHVVVGGEPAVVDGAHRAIDVVAALDSSIRAAWQAAER